MWSFSVERLYIDATDLLFVCFSDPNQVDKTEAMQGASTVSLNMDGFLSPHAVRGGKIIATYAF